MFKQLDALCDAHWQAITRLAAARRPFQQGRVLPPEDVVRTVMAPIEDYRRSYRLFKDHPVIGWPVSVMSFGLDLSMRTLLIPVIGLAPRWPRLHLPGTTQRSKR